jgi:hypothetical protein
MSPFSDDRQSSRASPWCAKTGGASAGGESRFFNTEDVETHGDLFFSVALRGSPSSSVVNHTTAIAFISIR